MSIYVPTRGALRGDLNAVPSRSHASELNRDQDWLVQEACPAPGTHGKAFAFMPSVGQRGQHQATIPGSLLGQLSNLSPHCGQQGEPWVFPPPRVTISKGRDTGSEADGGGQVPPPRPRCLPAQLPFT